jgi:hypothetical protein
MSELNILNVIPLHPEKFKIKWKITIAIRIDIRNRFNPRFRYNKIREITIIKAYKINENLSEKLVIFDFDDWYLILKIKLF